MYKPNRKAKINCIDIWEQLASFIKFEIKLVESEENKRIVTNVLAFLKNRNLTFSRVTIRSQNIGKAFPRVLEQKIVFLSFCF